MPSAAVRMPLRADPEFGGGLPSIVRLRLDIAMQSTNHVADVIVALQLMPTLSGQAGTWLLRQSTIPKPKRRGCSSKPQLSSKTCPEVHRACSMKLCRRLGLSAREISLSPRTVGSRRCDPTEKDGSSEPLAMMLHSCDIRFVFDPLGACAVQGQSARTWDEIARSVTDAIKGQ